MSTGVTPEKLTRKVGILGGMGPMATQAFYRELILRTEAFVDQDHLEVVIESSPRVPDRTAFLLGRGTDPMPALLDAALRLRDSGAELIVMPCNTAQVFAPQLEQATGVPFVPWLDAAADEAERVARPPVAILATEGTLQADIYGPLLEQRGLSYLVPEGPEMAEVMRCIYDYKATSRSRPGDQARLIRVARALHGRGAGSYILGCTELPLIVPATSSRWPAPAIDPAVSAARLAVLEAGARAAVL